MSSPLAGEFHAQTTNEPTDDPMRGSGEEDEEGEADVVMPGVTDDSSEEGEDDDEEEARKVREGFIVDEDEEEEEPEESERRRRHKKRKRHHRRRDEDDEVLEEDDLELLQENTGTSFKKSRLTRLRRGRDDSPPVASSSKHRSFVESSDDDLGEDDHLRRAPDIDKIFEDRGREEEDEDSDDFIDYGEEEADEKSREVRRREQKLEMARQKKARGAPPELSGMDANAWDEIHEVFGDGHDYDWALGDDEGENEDEMARPEMKYQDVFEPSEIKKRMLTEDDDLIRAQDCPERMQLATSSLSQQSTLSLHTQLTDADIGGAAMWVTQRISAIKNRQFFTPDGELQQFKGSLVMAVTAVLQLLFVEELEAPYIWVHKRDVLCHFDPADIKSRFELLNQNEVWRIYTLGQKYRSLLERKRALSASYERFGVKDEYYEDDIQAQIDSVEVVADATEWLAMKYKDKKKDDLGFHFHDDEEPEPTKKRKMPSRISAYEVTKKSIVSKLAQGFGILPHQVVLNFMASHHVYFIDDQELNPIAYAEQFADPDPTKAQPAEELLRRARMLIATELGKDPLLRNQIRKLFREEARITVIPTERGIAKIDESHPFFNFKYLYQKSIQAMLDTAQFLQILAAESDLLVNVVVALPGEAKANFERRLVDAFASDGFSDAARAWNEERSLVVQEVLEQHLIPAGVKWTREYLREEVEDFLAASCASHLRTRIDVAPYKAQNMKFGESASVLAVSWGKGDPHKDAITMVFLDEAGRMREHGKVDNLSDQEMRDEFTDLVKRRKPDVIVIGGHSMATLKLTAKVKELIHGRREVVDETGTWGAPPQANEQVFDIPIEYVHDDVARIYQHSKRAADEFSALSPIAKYCVGLARYMQSPLNEFAALGSDITAISFEEEFQQLVPKEKLLTVLERTIVDIVNKVGVDVNRAVTDPYYQHLLPFVCGLGPRKAQVLVKKIGSLGGNLVNRDLFIKGGLLTTKIFLNAAGFLRISQEQTVKPIKNRLDDEAAPDPLDDTRIHPEDYELARKMATDALELDEEDIHDEHPSHVVSLIMHDDEKEKKLMELNLDEFAISLYEANEDQKRHTLNVIRDELLRPFAEQRTPFILPSSWDILTMLSGETPRTLESGTVISVQVLRPRAHFVAVRTDSGIDGIISAQHVRDGPVPADVSTLVTKGQTLTAVVVEVKFQTETDQILVELSSRKGDLGDQSGRKVRREQIAWDELRYDKDKEMQARKKRAEVDRSRRVIKHPNFHNFNASQAEAYLEKQQRGDVVIRPSSKGFDHLAVTWKVDEKLYQHIDVVEPNADPTGQTVGTQLIVDPTHSYADLDELIVNHVQAMARRVEELMAHERFKHGSEDELHLFLKNFLAANPAKSMYGFTLNRKRPGHFSLCFLANKNSVVQTWPVRVTPEAYYLFDAAAVGVPELCDAFKVRHLHESQNLAGAGGKTPFGAGARTPARVGGGATPGHMSIRQVGRTPNPYGGAGTPNTFGQPPPHPGGPPYGIPPSTPYGYQTPSYRPPGFPGPPPHIPPGMNPQRAAMIQNEGRGSAGNGTWS